jgi:hypothetical protein
MDIKTKKLKSMQVFYFGKEENASLSIIITNRQIQCSCEICKKPFNIFMTLWDETMSIDYYLKAEMKFISQGINSGIKCLDDAEKTIRKQYQESYQQLSKTTDINLKKLVIKSLTNLKAALVLIRWFKENKNKYDFSGL